MPADAPVGAKRPAPETARAGPARAPAAGPPPPSGSPAKKPRASVAAESRGDASAAAGAMAGRAPSLPARYLLRVQYDGTNFHGFQRQAAARTVQGCVEAALSRLVGDEKAEKGDAAQSLRVLTHGSSRTDAGVHALDATLHVDLERVSRRRPTRCVEPFTAHAVMSATNHFLKRAGDADVRVWDCVHVDPAKFHARYCATARTYVYRIRVSPTHRPPGVFESGKVWHVARDEPLDVARMREAARSLVGARDFSSFRARGCQAKSAVRTVEAIEVESDDALARAFDPFSCGVSDERDDFSAVEAVEEESSPTRTHGRDEKKKKKNRSASASSVVVTTRAPSFLYHQVRLMVGTLVAVGAGDMTPADVEALLAKKDVASAPPMAPARGLYLARVHYDGSRRWDAARGAAPEAHVDE